MISNLFAKLGFNEWLSLISAVVALVSFYLSRKAVRRQERMQFESLCADHDGRLIAWADDAINAIADSQRHCRDLKNGLITGDDALRNASEVAHAPLNAARSRAAVLSQPA